MMRLFSEYASLELTRQACLECRLCPLSQGRRQVVFGSGNPEADIMLVGQGPSLTDDDTGLPYSGPAGLLLDKALEQAGLRRDRLWITNLHKCVATRIDGRTGRAQIRPPRVGELEACRVWLDQELTWVKPKVIVALGGQAAAALLGHDFQLATQRGEWMVGPHHIPTTATHQPTYLKRISQWDRASAVAGWRDLVLDLKHVRQRAEPE